MTRPHCSTTYGTSVLHRLVQVAILSSISLMMPGLAFALASYTLDVSPGEMQNNFNVPRFELTNTSDAGEQIVGFSITIGDANDYFYDFVADLGSDPLGEATHVATELLTGATLVVGDRVNDRSGSAVLEWAFDDFDPTEALVFQADIDPYTSVSGIHQSTDARLAWVDNGAIDNASFSITFSNGAVAQASFPDSVGGVPGTFQFGGGGTTPIPEPSVSLLLGLGLVGLGLRRPHANTI